MHDRCDPCVLRPQNRQCVTENAASNRLRMGFGKTVPPLLVGLPCCVTASFAGDATAAAAAADLVAAWPGIGAGKAAVRAASGCAESHIRRGDREFRHRWWRGPSTASNPYVILDEIPRARVIQRALCKRVALRWTRLCRAILFAVLAPGNLACRLFPQCLR